MSIRSQVLREPCGSSRTEAHIRHLLRLAASDTDAQRALADALPILIMVSDADGTVRFFNRRWHEYTGQPPFDRDAGEDWRAYIHPDDVAGVGAAWSDAVQRGEHVVRMRYRLREASTGHYRWFSAQAVGIGDGAGGIAQWIGAAVDVHDEVTVADAYQRASLPASLPEVPGVRIAASYRASVDAMLVGGDWYDAFVLPDGKLAVSIGDFVGHGLAAAVKMNRTRDAARTLSFTGARLGLHHPAAILDAVERDVRAEYGDMLATAILGILDVAGGTFAYASAGHPPPLLRMRDGTVRELEPSGSPLGTALGVALSTTIVPLRDVATIVLYTDGVIEGAKDALAGLATLSRAVRDLPAGTADAAATLLRATAPTSRDDAVALVLELL